MPQLLKLSNRVGSGVLVLECAPIMGLDHCQHDRFADVVHGMNSHALGRPNVVLFHPQKNIITSALFAV